MLLQRMPAYFLLLWVEKLLPQPSSGMDSSSCHYWASAQMAALQRKPCSLILRDWHRDTPFQIFGTLFSAIVPQWCMGNILPLLQNCAHLASYATKETHQMLTKWIQMHGEHSLDIWIWLLKYEGVLGMKTWMCSRITLPLLCRIYNEQGKVLKGLHKTSNIS